MSKTKTVVRYFMDILPPKEERLCANCGHWMRWGVTTGICFKNDGKDCDSNGTCKKFKKGDNEL